jgi:hypothetical protein
MGLADSGDFLWNEGNDQVNRSKKQELLKGKALILQQKPPLIFHGARGMKRADRASRRDEAPTCPASWMSGKWRPSTGWRENTADLTRTFASRSKLGRGSTVEGAMPSIQERTRIDGNGRVREELHLWLGPDQPPAPRGDRAHDGHRRSHASAGRRGRDDDTGTVHDPGLDPLDTDAAAGANGEINPARGLPGGGPSDPEELGANGGERAPTAGGVQEPLFVDARSLRITGRDQNGKNFSAAIYGGSTPQSTPWWNIGDNRPGAHDHHVLALGEYQKFLNAHYRTAR